MKVAPFVYRDVAEGLRRVLFGRRQEEAAAERQVLTRAVDKQVRRRARNLAAVQAGGMKGTQ